VLAIRNHPRSVIEYRREERDFEPSASSKLRWLNVKLNKAIERGALTSLYWGLPIAHKRAHAV
jgi:hypothetical protein